MPDIVLEPEIAAPNTKTGRWMVTIFNDDVTPYDAVIYALMQATNCDLREAEIETWEAHTFGKAPVHFAAKDECDSAAGIIRAIGVKTEVTPEWCD